MAARDRELSISLSPTRCRSATDTASGRTIGEMDGWKEGESFESHIWSLLVFRIGAVSSFQRFTRFNRVGG